MLTKLDTLKHTAESPTSTNDSWTYKVWVSCSQETFAAMLTTSLRHWPPSHWCNSVNCSQVTHMNTATRATRASWDMGFQVRELPSSLLQGWHMHIDSQQWYTLPCLPACSMPTPYVKCQCYTGSAIHMALKRTRTACGVKHRSNLTALGHPASPYWRIMPVFVWLCVCSFYLCVLWPYIHYLCYLIKDEILNMI